MADASPSCTLAVQAVPNAPRSAVAGWAGDALRVKVQAPALEGRANEALCLFLAGAVGLHHRDVSLVSGEKSRRKVIRFRGIGADELRRRLSTSA